MSVHVDTAGIAWSAVPWRHLDANTRDDLHVLALTLEPRHEELQERVFHRQADIAVAKHLETTKLNAARRAARDHGLCPAPGTRHQAHGLMVIVMAQPSHTTYLDSIP